MTAAELSIPVAPEEDLYLQLVQDSSAEMVTAFMSDNTNVEYLKEFQPWAVTMNPEGVARAIALRIADMKRGTSLQYHVMSGEAMAGAITLFDHQDTHARVGYYVGRQFAGKGYATRATQTLIDYAAQSDVWGLEYYQLCISDQNEPSKAVARKLGAHPTDYHSSEETIIPTVYRPLRVWEKHL